MPPTKNDAIRVNDVLKWGGLVFTLVTMVATAVWAVASAKAHADAKLVPITTQVTINTKDVADLKAKDESKSAKIAEIDKKLDTMVTILNRIDSKVGKP